MGAFSFTLRGEQLQKTPVTHLLLRRQLIIKTAPQSEANVYTDSYVMDPAFVVKFNFQITLFKGCCLLGMLSFSVSQRSYHCGGVCVSYWWWFMLKDAHGCQQVSLRSKGNHRPD